MKNSKIVFYLVTLASTISVIAQSCSFPIRRLHDGDFVEIKNLHFTLYGFGGFVFLGIAISVFTLIQVSKINRKLRRMGHSV